MPFYYRLKIRPADSAAVKKNKRRIAKNLLALRKALVEHVRGSGHGKEDWEKDEEVAGATPKPGLDPQLDHPEEIPTPDSSRLLRLATWNIREFDSGKYGSRLDESFYYIAEIISKFDLVAIQEVRENLSALRRVIKLLGPDWDYIATDVSEGSAGNRERMVFAFNRRKVWFRKIAGELMLPANQRVTHLFEERLSFDKSLKLQLPDGVSLESPDDVKTRKRSGKRYLKEEVVIELPDEARAELPAGSQVVLPVGYEVNLTDDGRVELPSGSLVALEEKGKNKEVMVKLPKGAIVGDSVQFARTPAIVSFQSGWLKINVCTVHIYYGSDKAGLERRKDEIRRLTKFLAKRASNDKDSDSDSFFIALGDFNIIGKDHDTMRALTTNGFVVPDALLKIPKGSNVDRSKAYDQIAYWSDPDNLGSARGSVTTFEVHRAGIFDFFKTVFREGDDDPDGKDEAFYRSVFKSFKGFKESWKYKDWRTFQMSDHLPMWLELRIDFGDEYLQQVCDSPD